MARAKKAAAKKTTTRKTAVKKAEPKKVSEKKSGKLPHPLSKRNNASPVRKRSK